MAKIWEFKNSGTQEFSARRFRFKSEFCIAIPSFRTPYPHFEFNVKRSPRHLFPKNIIKLKNRGVSSQSLCPSGMNYHFTVIS